MDKTTLKIETSGPFVKWMHNQSRNPNASSQLAGHCYSDF